MRKSVTYNKHKGWSVYRNLTNDFMTSWPLIEKWLEENVDGGYETMLIENERFYFKDKETATLFKSIWC